VIGTTLIAGIAIGTSALENPAYRYRMVLEPALIVFGLAGWTVWWEVVRRGVRSLALDPVDSHRAH
jgi:hypothetical protein